MKTCSVCHRRKKDGEFNKKGAGLQALCRKCQHDRFKGYYEADREGHYQKVRENKLQRIAKIREVINEYKKKPCADCERSFPPVAMDFDHVRGEKKFSMSIPMRAHLFLSQ